MLVGGVERDPPYMSVLFPWSSMKISYGSMASVCGTTAYTAGDGPPI